MPASSEQSAILNKIRKRSRGAHKKVKDTEAAAKGRALPGGLKNAMAAVTEMALEAGYEDRPTFTIRLNTISPEELRGISSTLFFTIDEDKYNSFSENLEKFYKNIKLLGWADVVESSEDEIEVIQSVLNDFDKMKKNDEEFIILFNTGRRANKAGFYPVFLQGLPDEGTEVPERTVENQHAEEGYEQVDQSDKFLPINVDDRVTVINDFFGDGESYNGTIVAIDEKTEEADVQFDDDGTTHTIPWADLQGLYETADEEEEEVFFEKEDVVVTTNDYYETGEDYQGTIVRVNKETAVVEFDDGEDTVPLSNLAHVT